jgi:hypothetical protein
LVDREGNIRPGESAVLKSTYNLAIFCSVRERDAIMQRKFGARGSGSGAWLGTNHVSPMKELNNVFGLGEVEALRVTYSMNS